MRAQRMPSLRRENNSERSRNALKRIVARDSCSAQLACDARFHTSRQRSLEIRACWLRSTHAALRGCTARFRAVLEQGLAVFEKYGATKWLSDDRQHGAVKPADAEWGFKRGGPERDRGWLEIPGGRVSRKVTGPMNMQRFIEAYSAKGVSVEIFEDPAAALAWLEAQPAG